MRVHELAKELGIPSRELIKRLNAIGSKVTGNFNAVNDKDVARIRAAEPVKPAGKGAAKAAKPPSPPKPAAATPPPAASSRPPQTPSTPPAKATPRPAARPASGPAGGPSGKRPPADRRGRRPEHRGRPGQGQRPAGPPPAKPASPTAKTANIKGPTLVKDLAEMLGVRPNQLIAELMALNVLASINERLDVDVARKIAEKHGFTIEKEKRNAARHMAPAPKTDLLEDDEPADRPEDMKPRPPIVTFLGHVDHGKTSLLDRIRSSQVAAGEHGGITQHIGASTVQAADKRITFLDTPGHAAFTEMRARGANLTDVVVLIIAADDGVMPQTEEAIRHAQAAGVPIMAAINKIDLPGANIDRVKQQLAGLGLHPEDWGGDVICCPVSAETGDGIDNLLEMLLLQSEMQELTASPKRRAAGFVVESQLETGMGPTATLLVQRGTLRLGDAVVCGPHWGRIKALINDRGEKIKTAGPSTPVKCMGLSGVPDAGAAFRVCANDKAARALSERAEQAVQDEKRSASAPRRGASLDDIYRQMGEEGNVELRLVIKADVQGSLGALVKTLNEIPSDKVSLNILMSAVGNITANDVLLASASQAVILGFNVGMETGVSQLAKREGVEIRIHRIIYELSDQVRDAMAGLLSPEYRERVIGHAEVKQVFNISKGGRIAGCMMLDGQVTSRSKVRVKRGDEVLNENVAIVSLKRFQADVSEVQQSQECGIRLERNAEFKEGDILEFYLVDVLKRTL